MIQKEKTPQAEGVVVPFRIIKSKTQKKKKSGKMLLYHVSFQQIYFKICFASCNMHALYIYYIVTVMRCGVIVRCSGGLVKELR